MSSARMTMMLGRSDAALDAAVLYSAMTFIGAIPIWLTNLASAALRGVGNVKAPAWIILAGSALTIPLSPAFIFGFGPFPRLEVAGETLEYNANTPTSLVEAAVIQWNWLEETRSGSDQSATSVSSICRATRCSSACRRSTPTCRWSGLTITTTATSGRASRAVRS